MKYSITDLSKQFDLPASTIRYYEKIRFYSLVRESVKTNSPLPKWEDVNLT